MNEQFTVFSRCFWRLLRELQSKHFRVLGLIKLDFVAFYQLIQNNKLAGFNVFERRQFEIA